METCITNSLFKCSVDIFYQDFIDRKFYYLLKRKKLSRIPSVIPYVPFTCCSMYDKNKRLVGMMWTKR